MFLVDSVVDVASARDANAPQRHRMDHDSDSEVDVAEELEDDLADDAVSDVTSATNMTDFYDRSPHLVDPRG